MDAALIEHPGKFSCEFVSHTVGGGLFTGLWMRTVQRTLMRLTGPVCVDLLGLESSLRMIQFLYHFERTGGTMAFQHSGPASVGHQYPCGFHSKRAIARFDAIVHQCVIRALAIRLWRQA